MPATLLLCTPGFSEPPTAPALCKEVVGNASPGTKLVKRKPSRLLKTSFLRYRSKFSPFFDSKMKISCTAHLYFLQNQNKLSFSLGQGIGLVKFGYSEKATKFKKIFHLKFDDT